MTNETSQKVTIELEFGNAYSMAKLISMLRGLIYPPEEIPENLKDIQVQRMDIKYHAPVYHLAPPAAGTESDAAD